MKFDKFINKYLKEANLDAMSPEEREAYETQLDKKESYKDYLTGHNNEKAKAKIGPAIMHPKSIELEGGSTINIDKGVRSARQVNNNTVQLYTQKLGGGGIGGTSKVGVIKLTFNSSVVAINK